MAVTKLLITSRRPFAQEKAFGNVGPYEQLDGIVHFAVDPSHLANHLVTDLKLAPQTPMARYTSQQIGASSGRWSHGEGITAYCSTFSTAAAVRWRISTAPLMCFPLNLWTRAMAS